MPTPEQEAYVAQTEALPTTQTELTEPGWNPDGFFKQRSQHRAWIFWFSIITSSLALLLLIFIVGVQMWMRGHGDIYFQSVSDQALEIISVSVFGQVFGVVYVIAHALWSNDEFNLMKSGKK